MVLYWILCLLCTVSDADMILSFSSLKKIVVVSFTRLTVVLGCQVRFLLSHYYSHCCCLLAKKRSCAVVIWSLIKVVVKIIICVRFFEYGNYAVVPKVLFCHESSLLVIFNFSVEKYI